MTRHDAAPNVLALVPARGGSERVPGKNIRPLAGRPLIAYTIEAALAARSVTRVIVSTDSEEIALVAREYGAETPFLRPVEIAQSDSTELQFFDHALGWLADNESYEPDLIVLLYPTGPLRRAESIDEAVGIMLAHPEANSLRSVTPCHEHPYKMWVEEGGYLKPFVKDTGGLADAHTLAYSQLPPVLAQNASIYVTRPATIRDKRSPTGDVIVPYVMSERESVDVNTPLDFRLAELLIESGEDL